MKTEEKIRGIVEELIQDREDLFIVDVELKGHKGNQRLFVFLDGDEGVAIDHCAQVSRKLGHQIEEENIIEEKYILEVSSAGMGRPLKVGRQFKKNVGRMLDVKMTNEEKYSGKLVDSNEDGIVLEVDGKALELNFEEIDKSTVAVSFK